VFWPLSLGIYALQYDAIDVFLPWRFFGSEAIRQGMVPLWNPYQDGGYPFFADLQYSIWNPELFIVSLFGRYNASTIQGLYILYVVLGGLGFRYLLIQLKLKEKYAFYGGILFMLSGILIGHAQSIVSILGAIWLPWALGSYLAVIKSNFSIRDLLAFSLFTFLMLSSGYQAVSIMLFYVFLVMGLYRIVEFIKTKENKALIRFFLGHIVAGGIVAILMLGIVVSLLDVFPHLARLSGVSLEETQKFIFHPKALISSVFPLAAMQERYPYMDISFQNIFNGTLILFLLFYGVKNYRKFHSPYIVILFVFGVIYGLASVAYFTPVQPFLVNYLPGFDLFFYPVFYRYFTWIILLVIASFGLQYYHEIKRSNHFLYFLFGILLFFGVSAIITIDSFQIILSKQYSNWIEVFRKFTFNEAVLFQSLIHLGLIVSFIILYFIIQQKSKLIFVFLIVELGLIAQLNIPITVHGTTKTSSINNYLALKAEGFFTPNNELPISRNDAFGKHASIWRNQGNFTNLPSLGGFSSFKLNNRKNVIDNQPEVEKYIASKPFAYLKSDKGIVQILHFSPNNFNLKVETSTESDTLIIQQAKYDGWGATINGNKENILQVNGFEMQIPLHKGQNIVEFNFQKPTIVFLFYLTNIGFLVLLLACFWVNVNINLKGIKLGLISVFVVFVVLKLIYVNNIEEFGNSYKITTEEGSSYSIYSNLNKSIKEKLIQHIFKPKNNFITLDNNGLDTDPELLSILNYKYSPATDLSISTSKGPIQYKLRKDKKESINTQITLDTISRFYNPTYLKNLNEIDGHKANLLTFGLTIYSESAPENIFVVLEIKNKDKLKHYITFPVERYSASDNKAFFMDGFLLPDLSREDKVHVYLWNNSTSSFIFSNFTVDMIPLGK
jgi:hypothetical protein